MATVYSNRFEAVFLCNHPIVYDAGTRRYQQTEAVDDVTRRSQSRTTITREDMYATETIGLGQTTLGELNMGMGKYRQRLDESSFWPRIPRSKAWSRGMGKYRQRLDESLFWPRIPRSKAWSSHTNRIVEQTI
ncbi:hypothetical protein Trydic_g17040 [Trypoxylus dichotomus]